uniref:Receptor expression-enhancing protein n=1 Tax=Chrysotila carterae TaxID=13221 RepID=A0A7S4EV21_CHRCT|mmetsp:Transcript_19755/g.41709  ORF Transcript_19755/g.41709 Transcript_19755/m.41709 type:complete len:180 (-) Transcript_19755:715-1254(-)
MIVGALSSSLLLQLFGFARPAYCTFKALRSTSADKSETEVWLTYWSVFALFNVAALVMDILISWAPLYYDFKVLFVLWLQLPYTQGAAVLYRGYIQPWLVKHQGQIDGAVAKAFSKANDLSLADVQALAELLMSKTLELVGQQSSAKTTKAKMPKKKAAAAKAATDDATPAADDVTKVD